VGKNLFNCRYALHVIEWVFEFGVSGVELSNAVDIGRRELFEKIHYRV
jgi:hypothetical protein